MKNVKVAVLTVISIFAAVVLILVGVKYVKDGNAAKDSNKYLEGVNETFGGEAPAFEFTMPS